MKTLVVKDIDEYLYRKFKSRCILIGKSMTEDMKIIMTQTAAQIETNDGKIYITTIIED